MPDGDDNCRTVANADQAAALLAGGPIARAATANIVAASAAQNPQ